MTVQNIHIKLNEETHATLIKHLDSQFEKTSYIIKTLTAEMNGDLVNRVEQETNKALDKRYKLARTANETLKALDRFSKAGGTREQFEKFVNDGEIPIIEKPANIESPKEERPILQSFGTTINHKPKQILQEDGTLRCKHCNRIIPMRAFDFEQLDDYRKHVEEMHGRLDESERSELLEIYPN